VHLRLSGEFPLFPPKPAQITFISPKICRFCWHHIKENLNKRCPACRRVYTDDAVEFKPIATQESGFLILNKPSYLILAFFFFRSSHKRLTQQKKQRDREKKDLEALGRKHLANVRVVQRNVVYIVGIGPRFAKEEVHLLSSFFFSPCINDDYISSFRLCVPMSTSGSMAR